MVRQKKLEIEIVGFGLSLIGLVLVIESLLISVLIFNIKSSVSSSTFLVGIGYVIFKMVAGFIAMTIGLIPLKTVFKNILRKRRHFIP